MKNFSKKTILLLLIAGFAHTYEGVANCGEHKLKPKAGCDPCAQKSQAGIGLYVGGQIGEQKVQYSVRQVRNSNLINQTDSLYDLNDRAVAGGPLIGWGFEGTPLKLYFGFEGEVLFGGTDAKGVIDSTPDSENLQFPRIKTTTAYGAALRIGKNVCGALVYARFGVERRNFRASFVNKDAGLTLPQSQIFINKHQVGFVPGIGVDVPIVAGISGRFEVREAFYDGKNARSATNDANVTQLAWKRPSIFTVLVGFTYRTGMLEQPCCCCK